MKKSVALSGVLALTLGFAALAQDAEDPFADAVETRHGLMLAMANEMGHLGAIAKGEAAWDAASATAAATRLAGIAGAITMDYFPEGSETGKSADSFAKAELWTNNADFLAKVADLNKAAAEMVTAAGTSGEAIGPAMGALGGACKACHETYRAPEN